MDKIKVFISGTIVNSFDEEILVTPEELKILEACGYTISTASEAFSIIEDNITSLDPDEIIDFDVWKIDD